MPFQVDSGEGLGIVLTVQQRPATAKLLMSLKPQDGSFLLSRQRYVCRIENDTFGL